jgi:hypothetical protein
MVDAPRVGGFTSRPRRRSRKTAWWPVVILIAGSLVLAGLLALPRERTPPAVHDPTQVSLAPPPDESGPGTEPDANEGPSEAPAPAPTDEWGREEEPFEGGDAQTVRALAITPAVAQPNAPWSLFDGNPLRLYDINGNGRQEIIAQNDNHWAYVIDSETGRVLAELRNTLPPGWGARTFNGPEAGVLVPGGDVHVVLANSASVIAAYRFDAAQSTAESFHFDRVWEVRVNECQEISGMDAKIVLADLTLDGKLEILAATEESGIYALRHDGTLLWKKCISGGNAAPTVADVTADGWPEVVHVSDNGIVSLLNGRTGARIWAFRILEHFDLHSASIPVMAAVGRLSGGPGLDIVVGARDSHNPADWDDNHALLLALNSEGEMLWHFQDPEGNPLTYTRPIITDTDADGENEVYWADWNTVGHKPPAPGHPDAWKRTGPANFYRISADGDLVWKRTLDTWWSNKDIPIADVTGDGRYEMLATGPSEEGRDGIWYLDTATGEKKAWVSLHPYKVQRAPVLGDLWGTGTMQWVIQAAPNAAGSTHALLIYDTQAPFDALWPHPPVPDTTFRAHFTKVQGNAGWIQTHVRGENGRIALVEYSIDQPVWQPMNEQDWGWSVSTQVPDGSIVRFRATSNLGAQDLSGCYLWPSATPTGCPG